MCILFVSSISCENKYSRSSNEKKNKDVDFRKLEKPFRMNKLNILWSKAQHRLKSDGGDKEGLREAEIRRKLTNIIKAETSGFTSEELAALKEEFTHHQDKINQYYDILTDMDQADDGYKNALNEDEMDKFNELNAESNELSKDFLDKANLVRDKHRGLRDSYDKLQRMTARGPNNREFIEPKVQGLWRMAAAANFTIDELASLKVELQHYESRLLKLRHLHADHVAAAGDKMNHFEEQEQMIKKHSRKVEKMHADLEERILGRHTEL
ncbi:Alpha-2-macroglobulin receptor-associated protein [Operophtera brumata]|uniref:Alpha-2-macroglobulin receptor-associated protein n=1 Tax=Operophtera brumata TaxID=104452 RepID=A0A0L7LQZ2_OPEBR|nr:Alpha-2-macroglobulin receptor-associated protein [Operophtera brumata]